MFADLESHMPSSVKLLQFIKLKVAKSDALSVLNGLMVKCCNDKLSLIQKMSAIFL